MRGLENIHQELEQIRRFSIGPVRDELCREEVLAIILPCTYVISRMLPMHPKLQLDGEKSKWMIERKLVGNKAALVVLYGYCCMFGC
jgi:hypothetical protein